jgi:cytochrome c oxidase cbb3-type subunit 3
MFMKSRFSKVLRMGAALMVFGVAPAVMAGEAPSDDEIVAMSKDSAKMAEAQKKFQTTCASCHGPQGAGMVGPNLTDNHWIKGGKPANIFKQITEGSPAKGMPPMGPQLGGPDGVKMMAAYVLTLKGKNLPGKPPQGEEEK